MPSGCFTQKVFFSYSSEWRNEIKEILARVENNNCEVFVDYRNVKIDYDKEIRQAISQSDIFVIFISKEFFAPKSGSRAEYEIAREVFKRRPSAIIAVLLDNSIRIEALDEFLRARHVIHAGERAFGLNEAIDKVRHLRPICLYLIYTTAFLIFATLFVGVVPPLSLLTLARPSFIDLRPLSPPPPDTEQGLADDSWHRLETMVTVQPVSISHNHDDGPEALIDSMRLSISFDDAPRDYNWWRFVELSNSRRPAPGATPGDVWVGTIGQAEPFRLSPGSERSTQIMFAQHSNTSAPWVQTHADFERAARNGRQTATVEISVSYGYYWGPIPFRREVRAECVVSLEEALSQIRRVRSSRGRPPRFLALSCESAS